VLLPDLIGESARQDASVNNLDTGEIKAAFDDALACDTAPLAGTIAISYARSDGTPIVREGQTYALAWPAGPAGSATVYATPAPCLQPLLPANVLIMLPLGGCQEISTGTSQVLRFIVGGPAPSLSGITLCEGGCPDAF
jgi:hypothetical protein